MTDEPIIDPNVEENYNEDEDEDFNPEAISDDKPESASDDSEPEERTDAQKRAIPVAKGQKRQRTNGTGADPEDLDFENSGDEGIIKEGSKQERKKRKKRQNGQADEDSGGEGGFVKTRSMRATQEIAAVKKPTAFTGKVTADIDAIWARLNSTTIVPTSTKPEEDPDHLAVGEDTITIQRTYNFAGKVHTETKIVPRSSAQAQAYLATKDHRATADETQSDSVVADKSEGKKGPDGQILSRPLRRSSAWDPNPTGFIRGMPSAPTIAKTTTAGSALKITDKKHLGSDAELWSRTTPEIVMRAGRAILRAAQGPAPVSVLSKQMKAQKLNVVDKSKLDWAEHVDASGAKEELEAAKKDKSNYLERTDFLNRVEGKAEEERSKARSAVK